MMKVCTAKFKVRDAKEINFVDQMTKRVIALVEKHGLRVNHIRFGRQVKSWGSSSVADYHTYTYRNDADKVEFWINGHNSDMTEESMRYLEWALVKGNFRFLAKEKQMEYYDDQDLTAYELKHGTKLVKNKDTKKYFATCHYADSILGFNYRLEKSS